jgi:hypothetical protein
MSRLLPAVLSVVAFIALTARPAHAHGGYTGFADFIIDWLPFFAVVVGLGTYATIKAVGRKAPQPAGDPPLNDPIELERRSD